MRLHGHRNAAHPTVGMNKLKGEKNEVEWFKDLFYWSCYLHVAYSLKAEAGMNWNQIILFGILFILCILTLNS